MSWWSSDVGLIEQATSESIPDGAPDLAMNLDICDLIRSKQLAANTAVKTLKKRLFVLNPHVQLLTLHLLDVCAKNGGEHFLKELASKQFMDGFVAQLKSLRNQNRHPEVVELMLEYIQAWALMTESNDKLGYISRVYRELKTTPGIHFPQVAAVSESFAESQTAPNWVESDTCMRSGQPFTFYNRRHHCRNCGGVFLLDHCNSFIALPHFGINAPVRVCTDCYDKIAKPSKEKKKAKPVYKSNNADFHSAYDKDLEQALKLSLEPPQKASQPVNPSDDLDQDMKAAIAASLAEMNRAQGQEASHANQEHESVAETLKVYDRIPEFHSVVGRATPRDAVYDQNLISLNQNAIEMQPQLLMDLNDATSKLKALEDIHNRIVAVSSHYDRLLTAELDAERAPQPAQSHLTAAPEPDRSMRVPSAPVYKPPASLQRVQTFPKAPSHPLASPSQPSLSQPSLSQPALSSQPTPNHQDVQQTEQEEEEEEEEEPAREAVLIEL